MWETVGSYWANFFFCIDFLSAGEVIKFELQLNFVLLT
jgi:hypothetical protein